MSEMRPPAWDGVKIPDPPPRCDKHVRRWVRFYGYWFKRGFRVTFHLVRDHDVTWTSVVGVQIGPWFVGAVRSHD